MNMEDEEIKKAASILGKQAIAKRKLNPEKFRQEQSERGKRPRPNARKKKSTVKLDTSENKE
jgi:hypothetical protein